EKKGIPYAIEALGILRSDVDVHVTIVGDAGTEPGGIEEKVKILSAINRSGLGECTKLIGYVDRARLHELAYEHHIFLHPSVTASNGDTEGGAPVCIAEMLATGMPVVSSQHCDIPEVMGAGNRGFLARERDSMDIAACMRRILSVADSWDRLCRANRDWIA